MGLGPAGRFETCNLGMVRLAREKHMAALTRKPKARPKAGPAKAKGAKAPKPRAGKKVASVAKTRPQPKAAAKRPAAVAHPAAKKPAPKAAPAAAPAREKRPGGRGKAAQRTAADVMAAMSLHRLTHLAATDWDDLMAMADLDGVRPYTMKGLFARGQVIQHKAFGLGIVVREMGEGKIQVSFRDGVRLLVCNRPK